MEKLICPAKLEKLLVCTDGSPDSEGGITAGLALAQACNSKIYLLEIVEEMSLDPEQAAWPGTREKREKEALDHLEAWKAEAAKVNIDLETRMVPSEAPYVGIVEEAKAIQPDLIIMGRHGGSRLYRVFMGNVTARVISHSPFNVLVVRKDCPLNFKKIMVASDGSPHSYAAWDEAIQLAKRMGSLLTAVSVASNGLTKETAKKVIDKLAMEAEREGLTVETAVLQGRPYAAIIQASQERGADLVIMGALGLSGFTSFLLGSVTERVIAGAPCSVLVVKEGFK
jgi:nucleotide-binding universal stress UspA family protein